MTLKLNLTKLSNLIELPSSKSYANRLLIIAARRGKGRVIKDLPESDDVKNLIKCFCKIGLSLKLNNSEVTFLDTFPECELEEETIHLNVGEGGTTARFLLSLLSTGSKQYILQMEGRLARRPWEELINILKVAGAQIDWITTESLSVKGPINVDLLPATVSCRETTQFITSLQLVFFRDNKYFQPVDLVSSEAYWDMTRECLKDFDQISVPKDWSSASYPMTLAALRGDHVFFPGLQRDLFQADSVILEILSQRGSINIKSDGIEVTGLKKYDPLNIDGSKCLDLIPTLVALALKLNGTSVIHSTQGLKAKESDRQQEIMAILKKIGASFRFKNEAFEIDGPLEIETMSLAPEADHRIVMMAALILLSNKGGEIENESAVTKSFSNFFKIVAPTK